MELRKNFLRLGSANIAMLAAQIVTVLLLGIVMHGPDLGVFLLCQSIAQTFAAVATLRFDSALPASRSSVELSALLLCAVAATLASSVLVFLLVMGARALGLFELDSVPIAGIVMIALLTASIAAGQIGRYLQIRAQAMARIERGTYIRACLIVVLRGAVIILLVAQTSQFVMLHQGMLMLACEVLIGFGFALSVAPRMAGGWAARGRRYRVLRSTLRRNWKFPALETPSVLIDSLALNAPIYLVTQFFGLSATASFGLAYRAMVVPVGQLALALTEVLQAHYAELLRSRRIDAFAHLFRRSSLLVSLLGLIACAAAFFLIEPVVMAIAGEKLREFAQICIVIAPWVAMIVLININSRLVPLLRAQELKLIYDLASAGAIAILYATQVNFNLDLIGFIRVLTASQLVTYSIYWLLLNHAVNRTVARHRRPPMAFTR